MSEETKSSAPPGGNEERQPTPMEVVVTSSTEKTDQREYAAQKIAEAKATYESTKNLDDEGVLELLLQAEKKCRLSNDSLACKEVAECLVTMLRDLREWQRLDAMLSLLAKRRAQSKAVIAAMLAVGLEAVTEEAYGLLEEKNLDVREMLLKTLGAMTEGRMFCERERAKIARSLAELKETKRDDIDGASDVLQSVNAETYGSLSKREKVDFILEQVRLLLAKKDLVRALVVSKKVQRRTIEENDLQDLKIRFFQLMIDYHAAVKKENAEEEDDPAYDLALDYFAIFDTACVKSDETSWKDALESCVLFLVLSDHSPKVQDMTQRLLVFEKEKLRKLPAFHTLLTLFSRDEVITDIPDRSAFEAHAALTKHDIQHKWLETLHTRTVQHNVRTVAKYYKQIRLPRLASILQLSEDDAERHVAQLVSKSGLYCKIDRPAKIANFQSPKPNEEILSDWASDVASMLNLVEMTCHLINKENMIHQVATS